MRKLRRVLSLSGMLFLLTFVFSFTFAEAEEEQILIDNEECTVTLTNLDVSDSCTLSICLENKSSDITYMFSVNDGAVNTLEIDPFLAAEVSPGKKSNKEITFRSLSDYGIEDVTDIALGFRVYDTDDWSADDVVNETIHIYPLGEENAVQYEREAQDSDIILADTEDATVIITGFEENSSGYTANLFLVNKTDANVMFTVDDVSVNGLMFDPYWAKSICAGNCAFSSMRWSDSKMKEYGISDFSEIEMTLKVYDSYNWWKDDFINEIVHVYPLGEDHAVRYERESKESDVILVDNDDVTVIITGYEEGDWEYSVKLFLENKTDSTLMFTVDYVSVNEYMLDPFWSKSVVAEKCAISSMNWTNSNLEDNGITDIYEIEMTLRIYDYNDWRADDIFNDVIIVNP